ncbi:hypothetical protein PQX77_016973 [Marasmius sp. AFHP31]|nr:hypothetical protein PQX77_016973 [Marasmius sp. AFHP31]
MQPAVVDEAQDSTKKGRNLPDHTNTKDSPHENEYIDQTTPVRFRTNALNSSACSPAPQIPGKPTPERSWEAIMKEVTSLDEGLVKGWKEDIDTLLVFVGSRSPLILKKHESFFEP